jgi:hypothetical protein
VRRRAGHRPVRARRSRLAPRGAPAGRGPGVSPFSRASAVSAASTRRCSRCSRRCSMAARSSSVLAPASPLHQADSTSRSRSAATDWSRASVPSPAAPGLLASTSLNTSTKARSRREATRSSCTVSIERSLYEALTDFESFCST